MGILLGPGLDGVDPGVPPAQVVVVAGGGVLLLLPVLLLLAAGLPGHVAVVRAVRDGARQLGRQLRGLGNPGDVAGVCSTSS